MTQIAPFEFTIASGDRITISHPGSWVTVTKGEYPFNVATDKGSNAQIERGLGVELEPFKQLYIHNTADYSQTIQIYIGDAYVRDSRLSVPSDTVVGVVDGSRQKTDDGKSFVLYSSYTGAASTYNVRQLWNASADKVLYVKRMMLCDFTGSTDYIVGRNTTAIGASVGSGLYNKDFSGSDDTVARHRREQALSTPTIDRYFQPGIEAAYKIEKLSFDDAPLKITPSTGLVICNMSVNHSDRVAIEYIVEDA